MQLRRQWDPEVRDVYIEREISANERIIVLGMFPNRDGDGDGDDFVYCFGMTMVWSRGGDGHDVEMATHVFILLLQCKAMATE